MNESAFQPTDLSARTGFSINPLDRLSARRDDAAFIADLRAAATSRTLILSGDTPVLKRTGETHDALFTFAEAAALGTAREVAFLGRDAARAWFATLLDAKAPENAQAQDDIAMIDLRSLAAQGLLALETLGALGQAKSLMYWHTQHRFCAKCGNPTHVTAAGWRRECDACTTHHFPRTDPVVIMLVTHGERCLLGRAPRFPANMYSCLAGFIEAGETFEDAVRREIAEEAGIVVGRVDYLASQPWPFPASLMIGCLGRAQTDTLTVDRGELEDARWFSRDEANQMLRKSHPDGLFCPPKLAIAHLLMRAWASGEAG